MADVENIDGGEVATAEEDELSECWLVGCVACLGCTALGASWALATLCLHATATSAVAQALAGAGIVAGLVGKLLGCCCCIMAGDMCLHGNTEGIQQQDPPRAHEAVD